MLQIQHNCELSETEGDIMFLPGRPLLRRLGDFLRISMLASRSNPAAQKYLRSNASIVREKRLQWQSFTHIIHPFSVFRQYWEFQMILVISILLWLVPYQASFKIQEQSQVWNITKNVLLFICCTDVIVNCVTGYLDKEAHAVVMHRKKIIHYYIKCGTFLPDLIGSFPTDVLFVNQWLDLIVARKATSLLCVFRVFSLISYMGKVAFAYDVPVGIYGFFQIIFFVVLALHWQSCFHWLVPIVTTSMGHLIRPGPDAWIHVNNLWDARVTQQYLASILRGISTFMRADLLITSQQNMGDVLLILVLQVFGTIVPWFLIAKTMHFVRGANSSHLKYQATVAQLKQYMRHKQLPHFTQRRIIQYYEFRFQQRFFRESEIVHTLSAQIRHEISMHSCRKLVENVTFFNNLPLTLLERIVTLLKSEIFLTNDVIVRANQPGDCMYFIATGTVAIYTTSGKEVCHLEDGAHFGEVALVMPNEMRVASVVAVETCELYRLNRGDFARTIHPYPMLWERIKKIAIERHEKTMILNEQ